MIKYNWTVKYIKETDMVIKVLFEKPKFVKVNMINKKYRKLLMCK